MLCNRWQARFVILFYYLILPKNSKKFHISFDNIFFYKKQHKNLLSKFLKKFIFHLFYIDLSIFFFYYYFRQIIIKAIFIILFINFKFTDYQGKRINSLKTWGDLAQLLLNKKWEEGRISKQKKEITSFIDTILIQPVYWYIKNKCIQNNK